MTIASEVSGQEDKLVILKESLYTLKTLTALALALLLLSASAVPAQSQDRQQSNNPQSNGQEPASAPANSSENTQDNSKKEDTQKDNPKPESTKPDDAKKDETPNPVQQIQDLTKTGLLKARDYESGWIAGIYVGRNRKLVPMTAAQREDYYLHQTFTTPEAYMKRMFAALIDQARGVPAWQGGIGGYAERFASREGQFITANTIAALGNAKLGYEVQIGRASCRERV